MKTIRACQKWLRIRWLGSTRALQPAAHGTDSVLVRRPAVLVLALMTLLACTTVDEPIEETLAYRSIWSELYPKTLRRQLAQDTLQGAFYFAAAAESQDAAEERWAKFLSDWAPADAEFEDAMHVYLVTWAELEMQRIQYLKHREQSEADAVSNRLRRLAAEVEQ